VSLKINRINLGNQWALPKLFQQYRQRVVVVGGGGAEALKPTRLSS
jgi:hypothetical protein